MTAECFMLVATVSTDNPKVVRPILEALIGRHGSLEEISTENVGKRGKAEFLIKAEMKGISAKDLNRSLLSTLRRAEKRTRLRAEWSSRNITERYFDYILKKKTPKK